MPLIDEWPVATKPSIFVLAFRQFVIVNLSFVATAAVVVLAHQRLLEEV